jgi:2-polyprenyl-3-methyl-5-hydroxy-6-metoxy-1,4-benzoquinol methylase
LDVGRATGDCLEVARAQGYHVEGIELSNWSSTIARERGLVVHQESLATFAATRAARYDVVTLWGVIEHFAEPVAEMRRLRKLLRPGGLLVLWTGTWIRSRAACSGVSGGTGKDSTSSTSLTRASSAS